MHRSLLFAAIVLHAASAYASERVQYSARIVRLRTEEERSEWCGKHKHIEACTRFAALQVTARSVGQDGAWRIDAKAQFIAMIGLQDMSRYGHEMNHVNDVQSALDSYLLDLQKVSFPTLESCEQARTDVVAEFEGRVRAFVEASNVLRDGAPHPER
jgi:hypothetical protein